MMSRELIYTAVTRAKNSLFIVCEADAKPYQSSIRIASQRPRIPGTTLREKIDFFAKKAKEMLSPSASQNSLNPEINEE
jgi:superfamily I DNA/RNA helicase